MASHDYYAENIPCDSTIVSFDNPYITEDIGAQIWCKLRGFRYMPTNLRWRGNPAVQAGDVVRYTAKDGTVHTTVVMSQKLVIDGGLSATLNSNGEVKTIQQYGGQTTVDRKISRAKETVLATTEKQLSETDKKIEHIKKRLSTCENKLTQLVNSVTGISQSVANLQGSVEKIQTEIKEIRSLLRFETVAASYTHNAEIPANSEQYTAVIELAGTPKYAHIQQTGYSPHLIVPGSSVQLEAPEGFFSPLVALQGNSIVFTVPPQETDVSLQIEVSYMTEITINEVT